MAIDNPHRKKALEVLIESLKLYFTFSTVLIAASLTYFSKLTAPVALCTLRIELGAFILCAILSILNINFFIKNIWETEEYNTNSPASKVPNILAIISFFVGLGFGIWFFCANNQVAAKPTNASAGQIIIDGNKIIVPGALKDKVKIVIDSAKKSKAIYINDAKDVN